MAGSMRAVLPFVLLVASCSGRSRAEDDQCHVEATQEPVRTCFPVPLEPVTDPESPDYGRVPCVVIVGARSDTPFCDCALEGYAPATDSQVEIGREEMRAGLLCEGACCEDYCFCQLLQFSGDDLAVCQSRLESGIPPTPRGWCYVEPDRGFGDPSNVERCPNSQRRLIWFMPPDLGAGIVAFVACEN